MLFWKQSHNNENIPDVPKYRYYGQHLLGRCHHLHSPPHGHIRGLGYMHSSSHPPVTQTQPRRDEITAMLGEKAQNAVFERTRFVQLKPGWVPCSPARRGSSLRNTFWIKTSLKYLWSSKLLHFSSGKLLQPWERNRDAESFWTGIFTNAFKDRSTDTTGRVLWHLRVQPRSLSG